MILFLLLPLPEPYGGGAFFPLKLILPGASACPFCESTTFGFSVAQDSGETGFLCIWSPNAAWISGSE